MPANVTTLVKQAEPGAELACRAHEIEVSDGTVRGRYGATSYYAARTLPTAPSAAAWLHAIREATERDVARRRLTLFQQPNLRLAGNPSIPLPGEPPQERR